MNASPLDFGPRLSQQEYEQKIIAAASDASVPDKEREFNEFSVQIDYKLGTLFPADKRQALFQARARTHRKLPLAILVGAVSPWSDPSSEVAAQLVKEFSKEIPRDQVGQLLDLTPDEVSNFLAPHTKRRPAP